MADLNVEQHDADKKKADGAQLCALQKLTRSVYWEWDRNDRRFHLPGGHDTSIWFPRLDPEGWPDVSLIAPQHREHVLQKLHEICAGSAPQEFTFQARSDATAPYKTLMLRTSPKAPGHTADIGIVQDISESTALSERARLAETKLLDAIEFLEDGFVIYDADDRLVVCNRRYKEIYPLSAHAMVPGATFTEILKAGLAAGEYAEAVGREDEWLSERLERHRLSELEIEQRLADGRWLRIAERKTADGSHIGLRIDITRIKQSAEDLAERAESIRAILDTVVDAIVTIDAGGTILTFNPAAERMFAMTRDAALGENVGILMTDQDAFPHDGFISGNLGEQAPNVIGKVREITARRSDGAEFPVELAVGQMEVGGETRFVGIIRDISERKQLDRIKREFISTVSHELKTPLTSITGALGLLQGGLAGDLPEQGRELLEIAYRNSERLGALVSDILDVEKIEAGRMSYDMRECDISTLIGDCVSSLKTYASRYDVTIETTGLPENPRVTGDPDRLTQVISNLLSNAVKFSRQGQQVEVSADRSDGWIVLRVRDFGEGIPPDLQDKIFTRFFRVDSSDDRHSGGTGLGLSICKPIVQAHGGTISVTSAPGEGSTFEVRLPA
ncbi:ATP-binding protein [Nisaea sediminum]|uniref:ATP-binding protein n=1 Tax=Nisaea sediminum TaxID=2775867 RepID=UPI0018679BEF|nr:ATP-binding protein [Nisaea sediminum]